MMKSAAQKIIFLGLLAICLNGCSGEETQNNANASAQKNTQSNSSVQKIVANDNIEELETMINIPFHPQEALWREENLGNPNAKKMTVVLRFLPEESGKIATIPQDSTQPQKTAAVPVEPWFPAELIAQSELSGDDTLKGNVYNAEQFFKPPYQDGRLIRMENSNYFVLELFSK